MTDQALAALIAGHNHSISSASDFTLALIVVGAGWAVIALLLTFICVLCGIILKNQKEKCVACRDNLTHDMNGLGEAIRVEAEQRKRLEEEIEIKLAAVEARLGQRIAAIWDHIDDALWEAIDFCCPRMPPAMVKLLKKRREYENDRNKERLGC